MVLINFLGFILAVISITALVGLSGRALWWLTRGTDETGAKLAARIVGLGGLPLATFFGVAGLLVDASAAIGFLLTAEFLALAWLFAGLAYITTLAVAYVRRTLWPSAGRSG